MLPLDQDTIAAISTPPGTGGLAVLRLSGPAALATIKLFFTGADNIKPRVAVFGHLNHPYLGADAFDDCIVTFFQAPRSFTGEDLVEISIHGGAYLQQKLLEALIRAPGVRAAGAGEFTFRAFLAGKMDLSRAEAVADLIHAKDKASHKQARKQLGGSLRDLVKRMSIDLLNIITIIESEMDFSDQEISFTPPEAFAGPIQDLIDLTNRLLDTYFYGRHLETGFRVPLVGAPNSGKSSLFNLLVGEERAIVTARPGTTRDTIEKMILIAGHSVVLIDTAGLRETQDEAELSGVDRSMNEIEQADLVIQVEAPDTDASNCEKLINTPKIIVYNKVDTTSSRPENKDVFLSCITKSGLETLKELLYQHIINMRNKGVDGVVLNNERHQSVFSRFSEQLLNSLVAVNESRGAEYIASDLRLALDILGEITGKTTPDDILNRIFSGFCVGK